MQIRLPHVVVSNQYCVMKNKFTTYIFIKTDALLNEALTSPMAECPPNSKLDNNRCLCDSGYRATNDKRECGKKEFKLKKETVH